jgi:hypothetical protein
MFIKIILPTLILILENLINSHIDAYKIKVLNANIKHGINLAVYLAITGLIIYFFKMPVYFAVIYTLGAFFNRQITFDIPLNLRRGLNWDYATTANPPKAVMDKLERWFKQHIWNLSEKELMVFYFVSWMVMLFVQFKFSY